MGDKDLDTTDKQGQKKDRAKPVGEADKQRVARGLNNKGCGHQQSVAESGKIPNPSSANWA